MSEAPLSKTQLLSLLTLTESIYQAIPSKDWTLINELDKKRLNILNTIETADHSCFDAHVEDNRARKLKLESTLASADKKMQSALAELHQELLVNRQNFRARQQARNNYQSTHSLNPSN